MRIDSANTAEVQLQSKSLPTSSISLNHDRASLRASAKDWLLNMCGVRRRHNSHNGLLLTFDDGPHPDVTPAVLDLLAKYHARAVFFIVGNRIPRAPDVLSRILAEGHVIGNHSYAHPLDYVLGIPEYIRDVKKCQEVLATHTGQLPTLFRPPLGTVTVASLLAPRLARLQTLLWSVDVDDWKLRQKPEAVDAGERLAKLARSGDIVLLHDDNPCVVDLLETALPQLRDSKLDLANAISRFVESNQARE